MSVSDYRDYADAKASIGHFIRQVYNQDRIHSSLGYLTPTEFESQYLEALHDDQTVGVLVGVSPLS